MKFASANNLDRNSGERSGGICCAPFPQTKALRVSSQILPKPVVQQVPPLRPDDKRYGCTSMQCCCCMEVQNRTTSSANPDRCDHY